MKIRSVPLNATISTCLVSLIALASASAQLAPTTRVPRNVPRETYDNPAAPPRKIESSRPMGSQLGSLISDEAHVKASRQNILGAAANGGSISVDPTNLSKVTMAE